MAFSELTEYCVAATFRNVFTIKNLRPLVSKAVIIWPAGNKKYKMFQPRHSNPCWGLVLSRFTLSWRQPNSLVETQLSPPLSDEPTNASGALPGLASNIQSRMSAAYSVLVVRWIDGATETVKSIPKQSSVLDLKKLISGKSGIRVEDQKLLYLGTTLENSKSKLKILFIVFVTRE